MYQTGVHVPGDGFSHLQAAQHESDDQQVLHHLGRRQSVDHAAVSHEGVAGDERLAGLGLCSQPE